MISAIFLFATLLQAPQATNDLRILPVRGNVFLIAGAGANIVVSVGKDGVLLVDSGSAAMSEKVIATVQQLSRYGVADAAKVLRRRRQRLRMVEQLIVPRDNILAGRAETNCRHHQYEL
jgi:hypothetical protein